MSDTRPPVRAQPEAFAGGPLVPATEAASEPSTLVVLAFGWAVLAWVRRS